MNPSPDTNTDSDADEPLIFLGGGGPETPVASPREGGKRIAVAIQGKGGDLVLHGKGIDLQALRDVLKGRGNIVMTRVADEDLASMDLLVEAGLFTSRSECAAFLIRQGLEARKDLLERVKDTAEKIRQLKEKVKKEVSS